jgi:DNA polymerase-3 subunit delta'
MPFAGIIGQPRAAQILANVLRVGKIPHAYIFHGIEGVGKKTQARAFFAAINCRERTLAGEPCGVCPSCVKVSSGLHPDLTIIEPQGQSIRIEQIRELKNAISFEPLEGRMQMFLFSQADQLRLEAANALLKILEEPLSRSILVLVTERLHLIPLTVVSRCQKIPFLPLPEEEVAFFLVEKLALSPKEALDLARRSEGSIGRAMRQAASLREQPEDSLVELFLAPPGVSGGGDPVEKLGQKREEVSAHLLFGKSLLRDLMVYKLCREEKRLFHRRYAPVFSSLAAQREMGSLIKQIEQVDDAVEALEQNANIQLTLEVMLVNLSRLRGREERC